MVRKDIPIYLDLESQNNVLPRHLLQGNEDINFKITLTRCGEAETLTPSAKITVVCIYGLESYYDKNLGKEVETNKGNYVLAPGDTDYNVTVAGNVIEVPVTSMITNVHGKNQFILHVDDGINVFSYNMIYYVDENLAYSAKATPNNLPTYEQLKKDVDAIKIANDQNTQDVTQLKADVQDLASGQISKANDDLSNVQAILDIPDGNIVHKKDGTLKDTGININQATKVVDFPYSIKTLPNTLLLGDNVEIHENGGFVENEIKASGRRYLMLDYLNDKLTGTSRPVYWARGPLLTKVEVKPGSSQIMNNVSTFAYGKPSDDHETSALYLKAVNAIKNFRFKVNVNGHDVSYFPSKLAYEGKEPGYNLTANLNKLELKPHFSSLVDYNFVFTFVADDPINLLGDGSVPYMALDENKITRYDIALKSDIGAELTAEQLRDKLQTLSSDNRLDASAIKNLPTPQDGVTEFTKLTDTPSTYTGAAGKMLKVNDLENALELVDMPSGVDDPDKLTFRHSLGVKAMNKSGGTINAGSYVFLSPKANGKFNMNPITRNTGYKGEMFGLLEVETAVNVEGTVNLISNIQTGVTGVSEGVPAYIGFSDPLLDTVSIAQKGQLDLEFGSCGIFGGVNSIGEYIALFDAFQVQSDYLVNNHASKAVDHHDTLPAVIDKNAHLIFLEFIGTGSAGTVGQILPDISEIEEGTQITIVNGSSSTLEKIRLQGPNLINGQSTYDISGQEKAIIVAGKQEWYVVYHTGNTGDLSQQVSTNTAGIAANKTVIDVIGETWAWKGRGVPTIPTDKPYGAYYVHSTVLPDNLQSVNIPSNLREGTRFTIESNDRSKYLTVRPPAGETIDGGSVFQVPSDTMNQFVKQGTSWVHSFGGVFPNTVQSLASTVESQLSDKLHTFSEIEADMINRGFRKKGGSMGVQSDQSVPIDINSWSVKDFAANEEFLIPAQNKGNQYIVFSLPTDSASIVGEIYINQNVLEFESHDLVDNELDYKVFISNTPVDTSTSIRFKLDYIDHSEGHGIEIDDGVTNKAGVTKINTVGMYISKSFDDSGEITLNAATSYETLDGMTGGKASRLLVEQPLLTYLDPDTNPGDEPRVKLYIQHNYFELSKPPGYLAYLQENEEVIGRIKPNAVGVRVGAVWFDDVIVGGNSAFIQIDKPNKALGVQDYTDDDPNVTGGIPTLIVFRIAMKGVAPNDGFVEILLKKTSEGTTTQDGDYLLDANNQPIGVRRQYKAGENLGHLEAAAIYMAKGLTKFQCLIEHSFVDDGVMIEDRTEGASGVLIQALGNDYATGDALLQFENDTMQNIEMTKHYNGEDIFNIAWALGFDSALVDITPGTGQTSVDGFHFYNNTSLKVGVANKTLTIQDNGSDMVYFSMGKIFTAEKTLMLQNKDIDIKVTLQDKDNAYRIYMVKWTGKPDGYTQKIIDHYDADSGAIAEANWVLAGNVFISEDAVSGEHDFQGTLTVPSDAVNFAVVMVPVEKQQPATLMLKGFEINVSDPFTGWILKAPELINEKHLEFSEKHKQLIADSTGLASVRYTINNTPSAGLPMPIGVLSKGLADIEIDHTINQVAGSNLPQFEGAIKFLKEGKAIIQTDLYVWSEKAHNIVSQCKFWYSKVSTDGQTFTKIPLSELDVGVRGQTKAVNKMPKFAIDVQPNDRIALFAISDQADGAYIQAVGSSNIPMLKTTIDFDEITADEKALLDKIITLDQEIVITPAAQAAGWYIELDYDAQTGKPSLSPKQRGDS